MPPEAGIPRDARIRFADRLDALLNEARRTGAFGLPEYESLLVDPDFDNAEEFVARLIQKGIVTREPVVDAMMRSEPSAQSLRTAQRHFLRATGLTHRTVQQIERARHATNLLRQGASILDTVYDAGYFDQAHLTRSLKLLVGQTPAEIARRTAQLSFLYKTQP